MQFFGFQRFSLRTLNYRVITNCIFIIVLVTSCSKNPSDSPAVDNPPDSSVVPPGDTTVTSTSKLPKGIILHYKGYGAGDQYIRLAYDNLGRVTDFVTDNRPYGNEYDSLHFTYTSDSQLFPDEYFEKAPGNYTDGNLHKILKKKGYPVLDTIIKQTISRDIDHVVYEYTKDSTWQHFIRVHDEEIQKKKLVYDENGLLMSEIDYLKRNDGPLFNLFNINSYTYNDTLNPFYQPYVAPFIFKSRDSYGLYDLFYKKMCSTVYTNENYETLDGTVYTYFDYKFDSKGRLIKVIPWGLSLGFRKREEYSTWDILY